MKTNIKYLTIGIVTLIVAILVSLIPVWLKPLPEITITKNIKSNGESFIGTCILDLKEAQILSYANYTADEFVQPTEISGVPIKLDKTTNLATRGTLQFVLYNIDPFDENFFKNKEALTPFLEGDNNWHFSLYLPAYFSSSNIYVQSVLKHKIGEIENYDYIQFSEYQGVTEHHKSETEPQTLDLNFYTRRQGIPLDIENRCIVVTIHYEGLEGRFTGFNSMPIIGKRDTIHGITTQDQTFVIIIALLSLLIATIIAFTSFLKKNLLQLPQLLITIGISCYMLAKVLLFHGSQIPYFLLVLPSISIALISVSTFIRAKMKIKKFPVWILTSLYAVLYISLSIAATIVSAKTSHSLSLGVKILAVPLGLYTFAKGTIKIIKEREITEGTLWVLISVFTIAVPFTKSSQIIIASSISWLFILILCAIVISTFWFFVQLEQENKYLTNNLQNEVLFQTQDLKNIISERDNLLRYLSHDMRKPISSIRRFLTDLKQMEENEAQFKKIEIIQNKIDEMDHDLGDLQKYSKLSYSAETSSKIKISDILEYIYTSLNPDCEANAIHLKINAQKINAYARKNTLISILNNLIFNAIDHAECKTIEISTTKIKGKCKITVVDDGKGLENESKAFMPYYTETSESEHLGLGLYICKHYLESMNGSLTYSREHNLTYFTILLPLA
ncbi:MAG: HAMP domain-containing histidine kinase [Anaeroplasmataceae bacterium]|nr:HAMP domain-containing histidine kinase [Anaeroplasmataceae bacterium]